MRQGSEGREQCNPDPQGGLEMPLKTEEKPLWHWTTAIAWIAFDIKDAPPGDIGTWGYSFNDAKARDDAAKGVRQLLSAVKVGTIKPIWDKSRLPEDRGYLREDIRLLLEGDPKAEKAMRKVLYGVLNMAGPHCSVALQFEREAVLSEWKEDEGADSPIHWTQLVARLAFDDIEAEKDDIFATDYWRRYTWDSMEASRRFTRAIRELCEHARDGKLKPRWGKRGRGLMELTSFNHAKAFAENIEQTKSELYGCIYNDGGKSVSYLRREYDRLSFGERGCNALKRREPYILGDFISLGEIINIARGADPNANFTTESLPQPWRQRYLDLKSACEIEGISLTDTMPKKLRRGRCSDFAALALRHSWPWLAEVVGPEVEGANAASSDVPDATEREAKNEARPDQHSIRNNKKQRRKVWEIHMLDILSGMNEKDLEKLAGANHTVRCRIITQAIKKKSPNTSPPRRATMYPKLDIAILDEQARRHSVKGDGC